MPVVMGILNVTPDSFYAPSRALDEEALRRRIATLAAEGADIIDIGACSTRPGSSEISEQEEIDRLAFGMRVLRDVLPDAVVSVDTFRADVARVAVKEFSCDIVNDISGLSFDADMAETVASLGVPYVLTSASETYATMHSHVETADITVDVMKNLERKRRLLATAGVKDIIIDPGIGFAKTLEQNYRLLARLELFEAFHCPILVGVSRKSLLTKLLDVSAHDSLNATTALNALCLDRGADILRVHDVRAAKQCISVYMALREARKCGLSDKDSLASRRASMS